MERNWKEVRSEVKRFVEEEVYPAEPVLHKGNEESKEKLSELMQKAKDNSLWALGHPKDIGGQGMPFMEYVYINEVVGRSSSAMVALGTHSLQDSIMLREFAPKKWRDEYLEPLVQGEVFPSFAMTEPDISSSDPTQLQTTAILEGDEWVINGTKWFTTGAARASYTTVMCRTELDVPSHGAFSMIIVPTDNPGFKANKIQRKMSMRNSVTSELVFNDLEIPISCMLPEAKGLSAPLGCLTQARFGIAWGSMGVLESVYSDALNFSNIRSTFDKPISGRQLVQDKLVDMVVDHTKGLLLSTRLAQLKDAGKMQYQHVSVAKRENARSALNAARSAREILGGSGITLDYSVIRHMLNMETVDTYEGTHDIHTLVIGRDITGQNALV